MIQNVATASNRRRRESPVGKTVARGLAGGGLSQLCTCLGKGHARAEETAGAKRAWGAGRKQV